WKTSTIAKLSGQEIPPTHIETPGIQTTVVYWPVKLVMSARVMMFRFQFWDCGDHNMKKYDHLKPVRTNTNSFTWQTGLTSFCTVILLNKSYVSLKNS
ncbi:hypothetical protein QZH41_014435, partial [Actinostola sp. cb2023]